jgi:hypothetical protein
MPPTTKYWRTSPGTIGSRSASLGRSSLLLLNSRFILNLPDEELASLERICFQVEQAYVQCVPYKGRLLMQNTDIGFTKTLFEKKTPNSPPYLSRNFPQCYFTPARCSTNGATITSKHSTHSCSTRPECLYAAQSCSTIPGRRCERLVLARLVN